jgi:putative FmdB family regulatory protein
MPIYEYKCAACGQVFEIKQRFSDAALTTHENCGGAVERIISAPALQFKGSGWYITDYARKGNAGKNANSGTEAGSTPPAKTDTPAAAPSTPSSDTKK